VEAFARNHRLPIEWAEKGVRGEDHVLPWQRRMARDDAYGVYFIFKSMEQGPTRAVGRDLGGCDFIGLPKTRPAHVARRPT
jgi:hypothetical protein